jgi:hypothetical protein
MDKGSNGGASRMIDGKGEVLKSKLWRGMGERKKKQRQGRLDSRYDKMEWKSYARAATATIAPVSNAQLSVV